MKSEVIIQKAHRFGYDHAVRNCGVKLVEVETPEDVDRAGQRQDRDDAVLQRGRASGPDPGRRVRPAGQEARRPHPSTTPPRRAARGELLEVHGHGLRTSWRSPAARAIRGPQSAGLLLGRKDLIEAARLTRPPTGTRWAAGMKVNKEEMLACSWPWSGREDGSRPGRREFQASGRAHPEHGGGPCPA